jgi:hypothetical protein
MRMTRNHVMPQGIRGFESLTLRHTQASARKGAFFVPVLFPIPFRKASGSDRQDTRVAAFGAEVGHGQVGFGSVGIDVA